MPVGGSVGLWNGREVIWLDQSASGDVEMTDVP